MCSAIRERFRGIGLKLASAAVVFPSLLGPVPTQVVPGELSPFCAARADFAVATQSEDRPAMETAANALAAEAPAELGDRANILAGLVAKRGHRAVETTKGRKALLAIDELVGTSCGFPLLAVEGLDYVFQNVPKTLQAGAYVVTFTNGAPPKGEHHEFVLTTVDAGVTTSVKKLLARAEGSSSKLTPVSSLFAKPEDTDTRVIVLEPGRYIYACFIDVNTTTGDPEDHGGQGGGEHGGAEEPHWREGMRGSFDVTGTV